MHNNKIHYFTLHKTLNCRKVVKRVRDSVHAVRRSMMAIGRPPELPPKQNSTNRSQPNKYTEHQLPPAPVPQAAPRKIPNIVVIPEKPKPPVPPPKLHPILDMQTTVPRKYVPESKAPQTPAIPADRPPAVVQLATLMKTKRDKRESRWVFFEADCQFFIYIARTHSVEMHIKLNLSFHFMIYVILSALITLNQMSRKTKKGLTAVKVMMLLLKWTTTSMMRIMENLMIFMIMLGKPEILKHQTIDISSLSSEFCGKSFKFCHSK